MKKEALKLIKKINKTPFAVKDDEGLSSFFAGSILDLAEIDKKQLNLFLYFQYSFYNSRDYEISAVKELKQKIVNDDLLNLKELNYKISSEKEYVFIENKQNLVILKIEHDHYDTHYSKKIPTLSLYIFGKKETQKEILSILRKKIKNWIINSNKNIDISNEEFPKIRAYDFFYYPIDNEIKIKISLSELLTYKQEGKNTYPLLLSEISINKLLKYIGAENDTITTEWSGKSFITSIKIEDFKIFSNINCSLSEHINILLGRNGIGKTSFLQALTLGLLPANNIDKSNEFQEYITFGEDEANIRINWGNEFRKTYLFKNEMRLEKYTDFPQKLILSYGVNLNTDSKLSHFEIVEQLIKGTDLAYSTKSMFKDYSTDFYDPLVLLERLFLDKKGLENKVIDNIIKLIKDTLNKYLNLFSEPEKISLHGDIANYYFLDLNNQKLQTQNLSEGYKDFILQITDIIVRIIAARNNIFDNEKIEILEKLFNEAKGVIIIDEFDRHLHPDLQRKLLNQLKKDFQNIQFVLTTHNVFSLQSAVGAIAHKIFSEDGKIQIESSEIKTKNILGIIREFYTKDFFDFETQKQLKLLSEYLDKIYDDNLDFAYSDEFKEIVEKLYNISDEIQSIIASQLLQLNSVLKENNKEEFVL